MAVFQMTGLTDPQIQHLMEYGDEDCSGLDFPDAAERDRQFAKMMSKAEAANERGVRDLIANPRRHDLSSLECRIADALTARGFLEVRTPTFVTTQQLAKMTITPDHPLYRQVFFIDDRRALRPMLAPNLYVVMRRLRDHTDGPVRIFEIGQCYRKESKSSSHLEEFTMMNLVELGPEGDPVDSLKTYIGDVMGAAGLEYTLSREESDVYVETLDVEVDGTEVASGAVGPHRLDAAHDIHEAWAGVGFGLERLLMLSNGRSSVRKTGKSNTYLDGYKIDRGGSLEAVHRGRGPPGHRGGLSRRQGRILHSGHRPPPRGARAVDLRQARGHRPIGGPGGREGRHAVMRRRPAGMRGAPPPGRPAGIDRGRRPAPVRPGCL